MIPEVSPKGGERYEEKTGTVRGTAAQPPDSAGGPVRLYGRIEPAGREVFVSSPLARRVTALYVSEGDTVSAGQLLCLLEADVETAELRLAGSQVEASRMSLRLSLDELRRKRNLYVDSAGSEADYTRALLETQRDSVNLIVAAREVELARAKLDRLELRSPIDGIVYRFDIRPGETLRAGGTEHIVLGRADLWVRLYVESFWMDRVGADSEYRIYDTETGAYLGTGRVISKALYLGRRDFRTEDVSERFDTGFQEVVLALEDVRGKPPIGLSVVAEIPEAD
jgi:multidrug efflux pump subunit AcrA (membrane-fusion protein)